MNDRNYSTKGDNKGLTCPFKPIRCEEGYCSDCVIGLNAVPEAIRASIGATAVSVGRKTKQEEIREGMRSLISIWHNEDTRVGGQNVTKLGERLINYLHSKDVVRKVKCPDCEWSQFGDESVGMTPCHSCNSTGYIIEPLIEGEK